MKWSFASLLQCTAARVAVFAPLLWAAPFPAELFDITALPVPPSDRILYEVSSYDRENRNARDGFYRAYYLYADSAGFAVFDEAGPGILTSFWLPRDTTGIYTGRILFYFDNEPRPRINLEAGALFAGHERFGQYPLAVPADSGSGGNFLLTPMPFAKRLKIVFSQKPAFYHFLFYRLKEAKAVTTFDTSADFSSLPALLAPSVPRPSAQARSVTLTLQPGELAPVFRKAGPGILRSLRILTSEMDMEKLSHVKIAGFFDKAAVPQVYAPVTDFFGSRFVRRPFRSVCSGADSTGFWFNLPMPFFQEAVFYLKNDHPFSAIPLTIEFSDTAAVPPDSALLFHTVYNRELPLYGGHDFTLLNTGGRGVYAGGYLYVRGDRTHLYLEGDERFYADGRSFPDLYGTGLEDYFLGGWYFDRGAFNQPCAGLIDLQQRDQDETALYRFHVSDRIPFLTHFKAGIEKNPLGFAGNADFASTVFYYHADSSRLLLTDSMVFDDTASEKRHAYKAGRILERRWIWSAYAGDTLRGFGLTGDYIRDSAVFKLRIKKGNQGVILRALTDCVLGGQSMAVYVDTLYAGHWLISAENPFYRFYDADFFIPESLCRAKDTLHIRLFALPDNRAVGFNLFKLKAMTLAPDTVERAEGAYAGRFGIVPDWSNGTQQMLLWETPPDSAAWSDILIYRDTVKGFTPSLSNLVGKTQGLSFTDENLALGRHYYYQCEAYTRFGKRNGITGAQDGVTPGILDWNGARLLSCGQTASCSVAVRPLFNENGIHPELPDRPEGRDSVYQAWHYLAVMADTTGDSAAFKLKLARQDTFDISLGYASGPNFGKFTLLLNGSDMGLSADAFSDSGGPFTLTAKRPVVVPKGENTLTLKTLGKSARSQGYWMGLDWIRFTTQSYRFNGIPDSLKLQITRSYPNPFNPMLHLRFLVAEDMELSVAVCDINGREMRRLADGPHLRREYDLAWDGRDNRGRPCAAGLYLVRFKGRFKQSLLIATAKAVLVR